MAIRRVRGLVLCSALVAGTASAACRTSPPPFAIPGANSPFGEQISVTLTNKQTFLGELLAVTDSSLILMVRGRVSFARAGAIAEARAPSFGLSYSRPPGPTQASLKRARQGARFPYGMSPEVMASLLAKTSQSSPDDLTTIQR